MALVALEMALSQVSALVQAGALAPVLAVAAVGSPFVTARGNLASNADRSTKEVASFYPSCVSSLRSPALRRHRRPGSSAGRAPQLQRCAAARVFRAERAAMDYLARRVNSGATATAAPAASRRASSRASAPASASAASLPAGASGGGVSGSRSCSAESSAAARKQTSALAEENAQLRKEVAEAREQLAKILYTHPDAPPPAVGAAPPDVAWITAQLTQAQRQVELLTEALVQRGELSTEVEAALIKLRQPTTDGKRPEHADWATNTLRRLRHVQFVEELASDRLAAHPKARAATGRLAGGRAAGRGGTQSR